MRHHDWRGEEHADTPAILIAMGVTLVIVTLVALVVYVAPLVISFMDVYVDAV